MICNYSSLQKEKKLKGKQSKKYIYNVENKFTFLIIFLVIRFLIITIILNNYEVLCKCVL